MSELETGNHCKILEIVIGNWSSKLISFPSKVETENQEKSSRYMMNLIERTEKIAQ